MVEGLRALVAFLKRMQAWPGLGAERQQADAAVAGDDANSKAPAPA